MPDLFSLIPGKPCRLKLSDGAVVLQRFARENAADIISAYQAVAAAAPFRHMVTPGGHVMSVAMTNCGEVGWVTDHKGYRYARLDPESGKPWPKIPSAILELGRRAAAEAGYADFNPDACLINRYEPGSRLTLHQDKNERDFGAPIVSVSLGLSAKFRFGGLNRTDRAQCIMLHHGDVAVWGGPARLAYHGVEPLKDGVDAVTGRCRINITLRKAL